MPPTIPLLLLSLIIIFSSSSPAPCHADPARPDPAPEQSLVFPTSPASTIPAFPEQSDVAGACPLDLPGDLFTGISSACSASPPSRARCCPALAAWLYSAHSASALSSRLPASADLPVLPDDSESCLGSAEKALRSRGVVLGRVNDTCDVVYCYCGIRLRPLTCPGGLSVAKENGRWVAKDDNAKRIERDCARPGLPGCSRCLHSLYQIKEGVAANRTTAGGTWVVAGGKGRKKAVREAKHVRDCQLVGLTWLLAKNRTLYLPTAVKVLRAFMMTPDGSDPLTCALSRNGMPLAVDSSELDDGNSAPAVGSGSCFRRVVVAFSFLVVLRGPFAVA